VKLRHLAAAAATITAVGLLAAPAAFAQDEPKQECTASDKLLYAGDVNGFNVQGKPFNNASIKMVAKPDGLHISKAAGVADAEVVFMATTVGKLVRSGVPVSAAGGAFTNLWFDTDRDGSFFDLAPNGTGTFKAVGQDDYAALIGGKLQALGGPNATAVGQGANGVADLEKATEGKINAATRVAIVVGTTGSEVVVKSVGGVNAVSCKTVTPEPTPTPTVTPAPTTAPTPPPAGNDDNGSDDDGLNPGPIVPNDNGDFSQVGSDELPVAINTGLA
jgi:hypothetical protein